MFLILNDQTVECFDTFKEEWRRVASMDIGRILPGIAILSGQVVLIMTLIMTMVMMMIMMASMDIGRILPGIAVLSGCVDRHGHDFF